MPGRLSTRVLAGAIGPVPGLKRIPIFRLLALAEVALLARDHVRRLSPDERRRLVALVRQGRGRTRNLTSDEREELAALVAKVEPRRLAGLAVDRISPVPLPKRLLHGPPPR